MGIFDPAIFDPAIFDVDDMLTAIRNGAATNLAAISGLTVKARATDTIPDKDTAIILYGDSMTLEQGGHGTKITVNFRIVIRCSRATLEDAQEALDAYIWPTGASSIVAAIKTNGTLAGTVDATQWMGVDSIGPAEATKGVAMQADIHFRAMVTA